MEVSFYALYIHFHSFIDLLPPAELSHWNSKAVRAGSLCIVYVLVSARIQSGEPETRLMTCDTVCSVISRLVGA